MNFYDLDASSLLYFVQPITMQLEFLAIMASR